MRFNRFLRAAFPAILLLPALIRPADAQAYGLAERPNVGANFDNILPPDAPAIASDWSTVQAFPNLSFLNPVGLAPVPGTNKLLVWEREGKVWIFDNNPAVTTKTLVVDLTSHCQGWDDSGLLGVAPHPQFATNHQLYVWYCWRGGVAGGTGDNGPILGSANLRPPTESAKRNRLARFTLDANFQATGSEYVMIDQKGGTLWHNGGGMFFHPQNGFLYLTNGDDLNAGFNTQRIDRALFSCVMRLDVDLRGGAISHAPVKRAEDEVSPGWPRYYVPNDNPFVGQAGVLEEFYALGLRSPHRMTLDAVTGRIFVGDVGSDLREEVSIIEPSDPPGANFQWGTIEGLDGDLTPPYIGVNKRPVIDYPHGTDDGSCVVGGYVYRGSLFPELVGKYLFGDNISGRIWYLDESSTPATKVLLATLPDGPGPNAGNDYRGLSSFGQDASNELYICQMSSTDGRIYKLQRGGPPPGTPLPATLGATGFFSDLATLTPSNKLLPYNINAPFWSDGAVKSRFVAIPNGTAVGFQPSGEWTFPTGSVFVKHFELPVSDTDPNLRRRLETRFLVKKADGSVYGATYKWRSDQSDADLLDGSLTESIPITTAPIGSLSGQDVGGPALAGSTLRAGNEVTVSAGGSDIGGTADQFHFEQQLRTGDFDIAVRVEAVTQADLATKAGLMVRESLDANARTILALVYPSNAERAGNDGGYDFQYRAATGGSTTVLHPAAPQPRVNYPDTWLRMKREGNTFIAYSGSDGFTWSEYARTTMDLPPEVRFGLALSSHAAAVASTAKFQVETRRQPWYYPSRQNCVTCHNIQAGGVLGLSTRQLNKDLLFPTSGVTDNQLRAWTHVGLFENGPAEANIPALEKLAHYSDTSATLEKRARSYLDANCSSCHRPGGVQAFWDARYQTPFQDQGIYYGPVSNNLGTPDARVVVPQDLVKSIMYRRVSITGQNQMPPLAKNLVDHGGVAVLEEWIQSLQPDFVTAPAALTAVAITHSRVDLAWQDLSPNEEGFSIERSNDGVNFTAVAITGPDATTYSDVSAEPFALNYYRVSAFSAQIYSQPSNIATATTDSGPPVPEIRVLGSTRLIPRNDSTPAASDGTDFGVAAPAGAVTHTFTLQNIGDAPLELTGSPLIRIDGVDAGSFTVLAQPPTTIPGPGLFNFQVRFTPVGTGVKSASVVILSNDADESSYSFTVTGTGVTKDLIGWWKFDETSGTVAADSSGSGRTGTLTSPLPTWNAGGHLNGGLHFTDSVGQSVTVANNASLNPTAAISATAWVFPDDWNGNRRILQKGTTDNQYRLLSEDGDLVWDIAGVGRLEATLPLAGSWFHVAGTYDGAMMRLYVNGVEAASAGAVGAMPTTNNPLYIGAKIPSAPPNDHFSGTLDDVRLYARALSAAEVGALAAQSGTVTITASDGVAQKGTTNKAAFLVSRTGPTTLALPVALLPGSSSGEAVPGADYSLNPDFTAYVIPAGQSSANVVLSPLDRAQVTGPLMATLSVAEGSGYLPGGSNSAQVQILDSPLNQWKITAFGSLAAAQGSGAADTADADADGLNVLLEAALGGGPATNDARLLPKAQVEFIDGDYYLTATYVRPRPVLGGITLVHRTSFDLATGTWAPAVTVAGYPQDNGNGTETVKVRAAAPVASNPQQFIRLDVSRP